jgi:sugar lactone lactonase YvrE
MAMGNAIIWIFIVVQLCVSLVYGDYIANTVYEWEKVDLVWPNDTTRDEFIQGNIFIAENNAINGIKIYKDQVYLTIPKLKDGIPFSLVAVQDNGTKTPQLRPFPNWNMHIGDDCAKLRLVQSMEIDPHKGYMWILDTSFVPRRRGVNIADQCPSKLVIWDLNNNVEVHRYTFPSSVAGQGMYYLNDIVLDFDHSTARWAYISDTLGHKLVVYDRKNDHSYAFRHASMKPVPLYANITIGDVTNAYSPLGINGIAMSSDLKNVYYCPLAGIALYRIPTSILRNNGSTNSDFSKGVKHVGNKDVQSDGMYYSQKNDLYYSTLGFRSVKKWPMTQKCNTVTAGYRTDVVKDIRIEWVDSFAFDDKGHLWFVSNNLNTHFTNGTTEGKSNYFVWKVFVNDTSYLHFNFESDQTCSAPISYGFTFLIVLSLFCSSTII